MSDPFSQSSDTFTCNMQEHDRDAFDIKTTKGVVETSTEEDSGPRPLSAPPQVIIMEPYSDPPPASSQFETMKTGSEPPPTPFKSNSMPQKGSGMGLPPSSPNNANVGSSSETSTVIQRYEKLQSVLDELNDEEKGLRQQIMKDAETHLEPTDYCLFEQHPPLWKQISKIGRNVGFQTLGYKRDPNRVQEDGPGSLFPHKGSRT
ncbi:hypothetical protein P9112_014200 [Eukaryota sp. TZLM1-RC]